MQPVENTAARPSIGRFSLFTGGVTKTTPSKSITLPELHKRVTSGRYAARTAMIRARRHDSAEQKALKLKLDNVTPAGEFSERKNIGLVTRSGLLVLDFDKVRNPSGVGLVLRHDRRLGPSVMFYYISPRRGLKVFIAVDPSVAHDLCYAAVVGYITRKYPRLSKIDQTGKEVSRSCLLCHDPDAYLNPNHETPVPFPMVVELADLFEESKSPIPRAESYANDSASIEPWIVAAEATPGFLDDYNDWYRVGLALASLGEEGREFFHRVSQTSTKYKEAECDQQFTLSLRKGSGAITMGTFIHLCKEAGLDPGDPLADALPADDPTPFLPDGLYHRLPAILQECCAPFRTARERDVMFVGTLAVLSGCFPTLEGLYRGKVIGANVYALVVAPAASGKGALDWARLLAWPQHLALRAASELAWQEYEEELDAYERAKRDQKNGGAQLSKPTPPPRLRLFVAADNGAANVIKTLAENEERGILFETEADTLSGTLKQDFGDYSALLRKASEHEPHLYDRKTAGTYELSRPALSVVLSGTPEQVNRLISSAENGLFSRFWFYSFRAPHEWDDPFADGEVELDKVMERLSGQVSEMITRAAAVRIRVQLTREQKQRFNSAWKEWLRMGIADFGEGSGSAVKRHGRACFRLCMLLTLLRSLEEGEVQTGMLFCNDEDFTSALGIADVLRQHALSVYKQMLERAGNNKAPSNKQLRVDQEAEAHRLRAHRVPIRAIADRLGIPKTTVQNWLARTVLSR